METKNITLKDLIPANIYNYKVVLTVYDNDASSALPAMIQEHFAIGKACAKELYKLCVQCLKSLVHDNDKIKCGYVHLIALDDGEILRWYDYNDNYDNKYRAHNLRPYKEW